MYRFLCRHAGKIFLISSVLALSGVAVLFLAPLSATLVTGVTIVTDVIALIAAAAGGVCVGDQNRRQLDETQQQRYNAAVQQVALNERRQEGLDTNSAVTRLETENLLLKRDLSAVKQTLEQHIKQAATEKQLTDDSLIRMERKLGEISVFHRPHSNVSSPNAVNDPEPSPIPRMHRR